MPMPKAQLPDRYLILKHMRNGVARFSVERDGEVVTYEGSEFPAPGAIPPAMELRVNDHDDPDLYVFWNITLGRFDEFRISELESYDGMVRRGSE